MKLGSSGKLFLWKLFVQKSKKQIKQTMASFQNTWKYYAEIYFLTVLAFLKILSFLVNNI